MVCRSESEGSRNDCTQADKLTQDIGLISLRHECIIDLARKSSSPVIPPKRNRKIPRKIDKELYKLRHNTFQKFKEWRC